jgi:hypothetical protein
MRPRLCPAFFGFAVFAVACETTEPVGNPHQIQIVAGADQVGQVAVVLRETLKVRVTDADGRVVHGVSVQFDVELGGGGLSRSEPRSRSGFAGAPVHLLGVPTNSDGEAEAWWRLGTTAGLQLVTASVHRLPPVSFLATANPGPVANMEVLSGDAQRAPVGGALADPLSVLVTDEYGNAVPEQAVEWAITDGVGNLTADTVTGPSGVSTAVLVPGRVGSIRVGAGVPGLPVVTGIPGVAFSAIGQAQLLDPSGDAFPTEASKNLTVSDVWRVRAWPEDDELQIRMWFVDFAESGANNKDTPLVGYLDIDVDQDPATGGVPFTDRMRPGAGSTGLGADLFINLFTETDRFEVYDADMQLVDTVRSRFAGNTVRIWIPLELLEGDADVDIAVVVGNPAEITDIAPNNGHLRVDSLE